MAASDVLTQVTGGLSVSPALVFSIALIVIAFFGVVGAILFIMWKDAKSWNIAVRVHPENPEVNGCNLTNAVVKAKRVRLKDGKTVFYYKNAILGYNISPALTKYTRPLVYDIVVTQDKRIFSIVKIAAIHKQRKELEVEIMHPDIEYDMVELQRYNDALAKDNKWDKWKTVAKLAGWFILLVGIVVVLVLTGQYYVEGKEIDKLKEENYLKIQESQQSTMERTQEALTIVQLIIPDLKDLKQTNNLRGILNQSI